MIASLARCCRGIAHTALASSALIVSNSALAQGAPKSAPAIPSRAAPAAPGPLARAEFIHAMDAEFSKMDMDRDGQLNVLEIESFQSAAQLELIRRRNRAVFTQLDTDHNGQIGPAEFAALVPKRLAANGRPMVAQMDANHDNKISIVEHRTSTVAKFDKLDIDKDGIVTPAEMRGGGVNK